MKKRKQKYFTNSKSLSTLGTSKLLIETDVLWSEWLPLDSSPTFSSIKVTGAVIWKSTNHRTSYTHHKKKAFRSYLMGIALRKFTSSKSGNSISTSGEHDRGVSIHNWDPNGYATSGENPSRSCFFMWDNSSW